LSEGSGLPAPWLNRKIDRALAAIAEWGELCQGKFYCSISGGKDSLVALHLISRVFPACPLVWVNQGELAEWEDCIELIEALKSDYQILELCPPRSLLQLYKDFGIPLDGKMNTKLDKIINQKLIYDPLEEYQERHDIKGYAWGIRAQESRNRKLYLKQHGEVHLIKKGFWVCSPVGFWKTKEIWQYIDSHRLPYPAMYDRDRMTVRNGPPIGTTGVNWGRLVELRRFYPEKWQQFIDIFPELSPYA
jgi:3'-phosphoadenosine 5'-phosphosulfate sulfotransferase (PAPS reductase)/FAD synthetase